MAPNYWAFTPVPCLPNALFVGSFWSRCFLAKARAWGRISESEILRR